MNIAFNINSSGLPGLGGTLRSLLAHCSQRNTLSLYFLASKLETRDRDNIRALVASCGGVRQIQFIDFDADKEFADLPSLLGDRTAYGRLLMPRLVPVDKVLYLDADLIIQLDVVEALRDFSMGEHGIAGVQGRLGDSNVDQPLLKDVLGWPLETPYFNSGVMLLDLVKLKPEVEGWLAFARKHRNILGSHDQTVLNAFCAGKFAVLPPAFNVAWPAGSSRPATADRSIIHFIGSPKPWDYGGRPLHKGYGHWKAHSDPAWEKAYLRFSALNVRRLWNIRRSIARVVLRSMQKAASSR
jgi:lipopolysaccharide biosynthesis glycosyltransferase